MDFIYLLQSFFLGIVEGLTEFLPISSTGHLILFGDLLHFSSGDSKVFEVVIQLGAILAVCVLYREKIIQLVKGILGRQAEDINFAIAVLIAFFPAVVLGLTVVGPIKHLLFTPTVVAIALIVGGFIILAVERKHLASDTEEFTRISWKQALGVGLAQCVAMIPGTSRSAATIIGGMFAGLSRKAATEFSFFLAIPTMLGATAYDLLKHRNDLSLAQIDSIAVGFVAAFISALFVIKPLVRFVASHSLNVFAWYRIILGAVILGILQFVK
ncbi:undecaprenyl-diphosphate phosphatase [Burkholderiaceae bacterium DAT-1]|nr:undecaprenyl-diphosphate phosphatase [Burkholderiaceae bacterium DAT-1]